MPTAARFRHAAPYVVMLAASGFLWWAATLIDVETGGRIGPDAWPRAIVAFMGLLCVYEIGKRLFFGSVGDARGIAAEFEDTGAPIEAEGAPAGSPATSPMLGSRPRMLIAGVALVLGYVVAVSWLGFFVTTALFLGIFPWAGGLRRPAFAAALGIAGSFVLVVVFMRVAYISLPLGEGPFRELSLGLMRLVGVR